MVLRDREIISEDQYSKHILDKLKRHHDFISITADDLLWAAKLCPSTISPIVESAIQTFKKPSLDLISGVRVGSLFLNQVVKHVSPDILFRYYQLILDCLSFGREKIIDGIHESLRAHIVIALSEIKEKKAKLIIRKFGDKLDPPQLPLVKLKPLTQAIKQALAKI